MRLITAIGVAVLAIGMSAPLAHAQPPPRSITSPVPFRLINQLVPPGVIKQPAAQEPDDLSRLLTRDPGPMSLSVEDGRMDEILELMGRIGGFEVYFSRNVAEWPPVSFEFQQTDYEVVLRALLNEPGLHYIVVVEDDILVVSRS